MTNVANGGIETNDSESEIASPFFTNPKNVRGFTFQRDNIESGSSAAIDELKVNIIHLLEKVKLIPEGLSDTVPNKIQLTIADTKIEVEILDKGSRLMFGIDLTEKIKASNSLQKG